MKHANYYDYTPAVTTFTVKQVSQPTPNKHPFNAWRIELMGGVRGVTIGVVQYSTTTDIIESPVNIKQEAVISQASRMLS